MKGGINSKILITSQDIPKTLQNINNWYFLKGMKLSEGVAFAEKLKISGTQAEIENFVQFIDGHPLTLELVASYLKNECYKLYELKEIEKQFKLAYQNAKGKHRKQEEVYLEWIIQQHLARLSKQYKNFLINLSVYRLSFDVEAASYMWFSQKKSKTVDKALKDLWHRSLLLKTEDKKYQFQPLIQKYIYQQKNNLIQAHQKAANYYQTHHKDINSWNKLEDVSEHLENFYHLYEIQKTNTHELFNNLRVFLSSYFDDIYKFLHLQGYISIIVEICNKVVLLSHPTYKFVRAECFILIGQALTSTGESELAIKNIEKGKNICIEFGTKNIVSRYDLALGNAYCQNGNYEKAIECYQKCLQITEDIETRVKCIDGIGTAYSESGHDRDAIDYYMQALSNQKIKDKRLIATIEGNLGSTYVKINDCVKAKKHIETQLYIAKNDIKDKLQERTALMNLGTVYHYLGQTSKGIEYIKDSIKLAEQMENSYAEAESRNSLANIFIDLKQFDDSLSHAMRAYKISKNLPQKGLSSLNVGASYLAQDNYQLADEFLSQSLYIAKEEIFDIRLEADSLLNLYGLFYKQKQISKAIKAINDAKELYERMELIERVEACNRLISQLDNNEQKTSVITFIINSIKKLFNWSFGNKIR